MLLLHARVWRESWCGHHFDCRLSTTVDMRPASILALQWHALPRRDEISRSRRIGRSAPTLSRSVITSCDKARLGGWCRVDVLKPSGGGLCGVGRKGGVVVVSWGGGRSTRSKVWSFACRDRSDRRVLFYTEIEGGGRE